MRALLSLCFLGAALVAPAETTYLGLYLQGNKIGYASYDSANAKLDGRTVQRTDSRTVMNAGLLGAALSMKVDSSTWVSPKGQPLRMTFRMASGGRSQNLDARFGGKKVEVDVISGADAGKKQHTHSSLPIPTGAAVVDDPLTLVVNNKMAVGSTRSFYVLDPMTVSFIKNDVKLLGKKPIQVDGKTVQAMEVEIVDPRADMQVYLNDKGDLLKVESPMGIEMRPVSREVALGASAPATVPVDLADASRIKPDRPIEDPQALTDLKIRVRGRDLSGLRSDAHETLRKEGGAWVVDIHPTQASGHATIAEATAQKPEWIKASLDIPASSPRFQKLARQIVGGHKDVRTAAEAVRRYVYDTMHPNAGIGVLRDANEVLDSKEGVCRDYAILTTTLLRAAKIPARLASGLIYAEGAFYYHAWAEYWDGSNWVGADSTLPQSRLSAAHFKLGDGNVDKAFAFTFLENANIDVLGAQRG